MLIDAIYDFDFSILDWIAENLRCAFLDAIMPVITFLGNAGWFWILCAAVMLIWKKTRKTGLMMGVALLLGLLVCNLTLKPLVARVRPYDLNTAVNIIVEKPTDFSFPSGHTIASFEAAVVLFLRERRRFGIPALVLAVLISFSRLYLYLHYPTDVLASVLLGVLFAVIGILLVNALYRRFGKSGQ